jgi:hypothetical protein
MRRILRLRRSNHALCARGAALGFGAELEQLRDCVRHSRTMKGGHPMGNAIAFTSGSELRGAARFGAESCLLVAGVRSVWLDTCEAIRGTTEVMKHILPSRRSLIPSSFVVRALTSQGRRYACENCGEQMFVKYESGLCPLCYNGRRPLRGSEVRREVPHALALVGVLDDPVLDELDQYAPYAPTHDFGRRE